MIRFPSLTSDQYAYEWESSPDWSSSTPPVSRCTRVFSTLGDGMCPHSPSSYITREMFPDYCFSMADYLVKNPQMFPNCGSIGYEWMPDLSDKHIAFAASIIYKDISDKGKRRYYSLKEQKVSTSDKLRYDNRYEEVPEWANGSPAGVCRLLWKDHHSPLQSLTIAQAVEEWFNRTQDRFCSSERFSQLGWGVEDYDQRFMVEGALSTIQCVIKAYAALSNAPRLIASYLHNLENQKQREAAQTVPAEGVTQA